MIFIVGDDATIHEACGLAHSPVPQGILSYIPVCTKGMIQSEES